ncbi:DUF1523 family protein [Yoonia sp. R78084]|uniref:DUF1523 family protein n=1 Tax=Yoonia sp. R78084 TaxID=3093869 RepID=UPI0037DCF1BA
MRKIKITFRVIVFLMIGGLLHYALPQHDVVRVVNTYQERQDLNDWTRIFWARPDDQSATLINRDVQFIQTVKMRTWLLGFVPRDTTEVMVYRNEDTGWGWPFYFKFDTANLQTEADDLSSTAQDPQWAVMTHYGWRNEYFSAFPNAVAIRPIDNPNVTIIPWFNIFFFIALMAALLFIRAMWRQFRERSVDPLLDAAEHQFDEVQAEVAQRRGRFTKWLDSWRDKNKNRPVK